MRPPICRALLKAGADASVADGNGKTPLQAAARASRASQRVAAFRYAPVWLADAETTVSLFKACCLSRRGIARQIRHVSLYERVVLWSCRLIDRWVKVRTTSVTLVCCCRWCLLSRRACLADNSLSCSSARAGTLSARFPVFSYTLGCCVSLRVVGLLAYGGGGGARACAWEVSEASVGER